jgi:hypothetical protein
VPSSFAFAAYEIVIDRLSWPPLLFFIAGLFILIAERRRRALARH